MTPSLPLVLVYGTQLILIISIIQINYGEVHNIDSMKQLRVPANQTQVVFQLMLATEYYFSVAARNQNGQGPFSAQETIMTHVTGMYYSK